VRTCTNTACVKKHVSELRPRVVLVDDRLYNHIEYQAKVKESGVKERHRRKPILLAGNLANHFKILLKSNYRRFRKELRRFEK